MTAVIFLGPTMPVSEAREIVDAIYLPPAAQGDLTEAVMQHKPTVVGLIDGTFLQSLSVWHKEILFALNRGIRVLGASSMGALRAAETAAFGMQGVGTIYRWYAEGELNDDDEVALAHGTAESGYRKYSEPMVNVRATLAAAQAAGVLSSQDHQQLIQLAKGIYFADRTFPRLLAAAGMAGIKPDAIEALSTFVAVHYVDLKRDDAVAMLREVAAAQEEPTAGPPPWEFVRSTHFQTLYSRGRRVRHDGVAVALEDIANHAALFDNDFDALNFHALNRMLVGVFADHIGIEPSEADIESEVARFRRGKGLDSDEAFDAWLGRNDVDAAEMRDLLALVAVCRRLHRWFIIANWMERTAPAILDEMRLTGTYEQSAERAAAHERLLQSRPDIDARVPVNQPLDDLWEEHAEWTGRTIPIDPRSWAEEAGFHGADNLRSELKRARTARRAMLELLFTEPHDHAQP